MSTTLNHTQPAPSAGAQRSRASRRLGYRRFFTDSRTAYVFLAPWFLGLFGVTLGPMIASGYLSFTNYSLLDTPRWAGLENYARLASDPRFYGSLKVTLIYVFISVPLQLTFALLLAMVLDRGVRGLSIYRSVYYLPSLMGGSVAIAILWRQVFGTQGLVNAALAAVGYGNAPGWVSNPDYALGTLIVLNVWTFGSPMVIFLAGLRQIPTIYHEAASIDGAGRLRRFWHVTLPLLSPVIFFNLILQTINAFHTFTQAFVVSGGTGGPADSTLFYTLYLYQTGFRFFNMGYASALAWVLLFIVGALTAVNFYVANKWVFYEDK